MTEYKSKVKYEAPIEINIEEDFPDLGSMAVSEIENMISSAVLKVGITVDKEELIKALRYDRGQYEKGYADGKRDAAAAIEALQAEVERLKDSNEELREKQTFIDHYGTEWMTSAKDVPTAAYKHGYADGRAEVKAQLPKRGEWTEIEDYDGDFHYQCSVCGEEWYFIDGTPADNNANYCPRCGAKMTEVQDEA